MNFDHYLQQATSSGPLTIDESWGQGRTTFGGLSAALLLQQIEQQTGSDDRLRSASISFCGPLNTGIPFTLATRTVRQGKSVAHFQGEARQNEDTVTLLNACYGRERPSAIDIAYPCASPGVAGAGQTLPYIKGITPEFTRHIEFTYLEGGLPFTNSPHNHLRGWMRFRDCSGPLTNPHLLALIDAWPPTVLQKLRSPAPCASVTWSLEMITPLSQLDDEPEAGAWLWYEADIRQAHHGYGHTEARIYTAAGVPLALSRQLVTIYDQR